jgi:hypothetical protein
MNFTNANESNGIDLQTTFEITTGIFSFLFVISEWLGKSKCKQNTVMDIFLSLCNKMAKCEKEQESQPPETPQV